MENFCSQGRTAFLFGQDQETRVGEQIKALGGVKVLLLYPHFCAAGGVIDTVRRELGRSDLDCYELELEESLPLLEKIAKAERFCEDHDVNFVLALGDENCINFAKAVAAGAYFLGDVFQLFREGITPTNALPLGVILTLPGSGYELSETMRVVEKKPEGYYEIYHAQSPCLTPRFAVLNPDLITALPSRLGEVCANILCRVVEAYFTNTRGGELTDRVCESIILTLLGVQSKLKADPDNYVALSNLIWAGILSHSAISLDRQLDLALERFADALMSCYGCSHAEGVAVVLPVWLECAVQKNVMRVAQFASRALLVPFNYADPDKTAQAGIRKLRELLFELRLPSCFEDLQGSSRDVGKILDRMGLKEGLQLGEYLRLDRTACEVILSHTLISPLA